MTAAAAQERMSTITVANDGSNTNQASLQESPNTITNCRNQSQGTQSSRSTINTNKNCNNNDGMTTSASCPRQKILLAVVLVGFWGFVIADALKNGRVGDAASGFLEWFEGHPATGFFAFVLVYFLATILFVPAAVLAMGSGFAFAHAFGLGVGIPLATLAAFVAASAGATVSFLLGRFLFRKCVVDNLVHCYPVVAALDAALKTKGLRILILLRLSPLVFFNAVNYAAGVSGVTLLDFVLALVFILPGVVLYICLGATAGSLANATSSGRGETVTTVSIVVGLVFCMVAVLTLSFFTKKEVDKIIQATGKKAQDQRTDEKATDVPLLGPV